MSLFGITFAAPLVLLGMIALPLIWWLLRLTPPRPRQEVFPPKRILEQIAKPEETPAQSPWWLTLLRLLMAALVILALADPIRNALEENVQGDGPLLVLVDDGWTAGLNWSSRVTSARALVEDAEDAGRPVALAFLSEGDKAQLAPQAAGDALRRLTAHQPLPLRTDLTPLATKISADTQSFGTIAWLSGGIESPGSAELGAALAAKGADGTLLFSPSLDDTLALSDVRNDPDALIVDIARAATGAERAGVVTAHDVQGRALASAPFAFNGDAGSSEARFELPAELRNDFVRLSIDGIASAGAVHLLDERFRRRNVGLVSGENADRDQPLLSPLYYISRALAPFSQLRQPQDPTLLGGIGELLETQISTLVLADIGTLPAATEEQVSAWVEQGGVLVRFAGPRLAAAQDDPLLPVALRQGDRNLGGTLTWTEPQTLASFDPSSPFAGIPVPEDVTISRQVLAEPDIDLEQRTWASLADGTPLVTANRIGDGWIILFHVTADANWSTLPLSGAFVDMLRRIVAISNGALSSTQLQRSAQGGGSGEAPIAVLPPLRNLDGYGVLGGAAERAIALNVRQSALPPVTLDNPPGLYGANDAFVALNLFDGDAELKPLDASVLPGVEARPYREEAPQRFKPWLLALALGLMALDCLAVLWLAGAFQKRLKPSAAALSIALAALIALPGQDALAQEQGIIRDYEAALKTRIAYVRTGIAEIDEISRKGLIGLTDFVSSRTSLEPAEPMGVNVETDELSFFPLLYWPVDERSPVPDAEAMARVDAFMKQGGTVLFDTRDQLMGGFGGGTVSPATQKLRAILASLDVPPLEPVPDNHVLTRAFYLLDIFPGRYSDGPLWVEASVDESSADRPTRVGDGVSSILITSNDFAGAWAIEPSGDPTLPVVPESGGQRTYAYRTGVNIVMYTLTGNYKSDQVHIPALLERLGQ